MITNDRKGLRETGNSFNLNLRKIGSAEYWNSLVARVEADAAKNLKKGDVFEIRLTDNFQEIAWYWANKESYMPSAPLFKETPWVAEHVHTGGYYIHARLEV